MCCSCGCGHPNRRHGDARNITLMQIQAAAKAAGCSDEQAAENMLSCVEHAIDHGNAKKSAEVGCQVFKTSDERRYTLGVAYPANRPDVGKAADGFRDFAGPEALEQAAWSFMRKGARIGLDHAAGTDGAGTVVESYIYRGPDWPQPGGYVVKAGDWLLGVVWEVQPWQAIKAGQRNGLSPQGSARRRTPSPEALAALRDL